MKHRFLVEMEVDTIDALHWITARLDGGDAAFKIEPITEGQYRAAKENVHAPHCLSRDCLRGSPALDRSTALSSPEMFKPAGCECRCYWCRQS